MPFISAKDNRELSQSLTPYESVASPEFGDVFSASVGMVFDESLSISSALNREGWRERERLTKDYLSSNQNLERRKYIDRRGRFDYNQLSQDAPESGVKTDQQLERERSEYLSLKRGYAKDVVDRGNGVAQFLGMATGFMLDPVNVATMGVGSSVSAAKATTTIGRAMLTARDAAVIGSATELAIQPLVYEHKSDINSPYTTIDAIEAMAGAAIGGAAIGAFTGGISGMLKSVRSAADELPQTGDIQQAKESLMAMEQTLKNAPDKSAEGEASFLKELDQQKNISGSPSKTLDQYKIPDEIQDKPSFDVVNEIKVDDDFYEPNLAVGRQSEILDSLGVKDDFDRDMLAFGQIDSPKMVRDGEVVDAASVMKGLDDDMEGINSILVCTNG